VTKSAESFATRLAIPDLHKKTAISLYKSDREMADYGPMQLIACMKQRRVYKSYAKVPIPGLI
jgi:hypothetical protein